MSSPSFVRLKCAVDTLRRRQDRLQHDVVEMKQQLRQLQMNQKTSDSPGTECVTPPDSWTFEWVASGLFLLFGIGAVVCARKS